MFVSFCTIFPEGSTEREFLTNIETIVRNSLLHDKLKSYFADPESTKEALLNKVTFCNDRIKVWLRISHDLNVLLKPVQHTIVFFV